MWGLRQAAILALAAASALALQVELEDGAGFLDEEKDAVVIEGDTPGRRKGRQLFELPTATVLSPISSLTRASLDDVPCLSKDKGTGLCKKVKSCYPNFKLFDFSSEDTWVMGLYDTCSYQSALGRQVFGVCCNNTVPDELPEEPVNEEAKIDDENDAIVDDFPIEAQSVRRNCGQVPGGLHQGHGDDALDRAHHSRVLSRDAEASNDSVLPGSSFLLTCPESQIVRQMNLIS